MTKNEVKQLQRDLNRFNKRFRLKHKPLSADGKRGPATNKRIKLTKYYLGYLGDPNIMVNDQFKARLKHPRWGYKKFGVSRRDWMRGAARRTARRKALRSPKWSWAWSGCRGVTNEVIHIVKGRAPITSRKRWATFGNPGSDHHMSQRNADAVDFGTANNYDLAREIARRLGGEWSGDYDSFIIRRKGKSFRVQIIAGTHGTGPHLHVGVRRA